MDGRYAGAAMHPALYPSLSSPSASPTDLQFAGWPPSGGFSFGGRFDASLSSVPPGLGQRDFTDTQSRTASSLPSSSNSLDVNELAGRLLSVVQERDKLQGALEESRRICREQSELISTLKNVTDLGPPLQASPRRSDYVLVGNWNAADAKHNAKKPYRFIVDSQGNWVGQPRVSRAIQVGKTILQELNRLGMLSGSWRNCGIRPINLFINALEQAFVEFTYCGDHWKADHFAMLIFREWKRRRGKELKGAANGKRKLDDVDDEDDEDDDEGDDEDEDELAGAPLSDEDQPLNDVDNDRQPARKKQRRAVSESAADVAVPKARTPGTGSSHPIPFPTSDTTRPPTSAPPQSAPTLAQRPAAVPDADQVTASKPAATSRPAVRFIPPTGTPTVQQLNIARSVLQNQRAAFTVPAVASGPATQGSASIRGLRLPGEQDPTANSARAKRALTDLEPPAEGAGTELEAPGGRETSPSAAPLVRPKGTHEFPLRKKSKCPEMHVRVAWALRTAPEQFSRPNFEAYMKTQAGKAELELMKVRVKTCQDTGLDV